MEQLDFITTRKLLKKYDLPICKSEIFNVKKEADKFIGKIGFPVVLKIFSPKIIHKTERNAVIVGINNKREFDLAWKRLGGKDILIQEMVKGEEMLVGMKRDNEFGPVIMVGLGGVFVELSKDVSLRLAPINKQEALKMINSFKGSQILKGFRGKERCNVDELAEIIVNLSKLSVNEENIQSIDFNPVIVNKKGALIVDFRIIYA